MRKALQRLRPVFHQESSCAERSGGAMQQVRNLFRSTEQLAKTSSMPARHPRQQPSQRPTAESSSETVTASAAPEVSANAALEAAPAAGTPAVNQQYQAAQAVTSSLLFPWERRQFDGSGGGLRTWEKVYWGVFVTSMSIFLFSRIMPSNTPEEPAVDEAAETKKLRQARKLLAGAAFTAEEANAFEGLSPAEVQEFVAKATKNASTADPFEGMDPEEINTLLEEWRAEEDPKDG